MISVIIPVYNDPDGIKDTLESLVNQETNCNYEIIPVDNNSGDETANVIESYEQNYQEIVKGSEVTDIQSSYAARNEGLNEANGEIICFLDADMWVKKDYISKINEFFAKNPQISYIGCKVEIVRANNTITSLYDKITGFHVKEYIQEKDFAPTCCLSVRKNVFEAIGDFNQELISGGDKAFGKEVESKQINMKYVDHITVYHPAREHWKELMEKYFRIGRGWQQKQKLGTEKSKNDRIMTEWAEIISLFDLRPWDSEKIDCESFELGFYEKLGLCTTSFLKKVSIYAGYNYERLHNSLA